MLRLYDPFSWIEQENTNTNTNTNENTIPYPSQLYTLNLHEYSKQCMVSFNSYESGKDNITTFDNILKTIGGANDIDDYYDNDYTSYSCILCATGKRAFYQATFDIISEEDENDENLLVYSYFMQKVFPNATNIICDGDDACAYATFRLFEKSWIDIYCRGEGSCDYAMIENVESLYCFGSDSCSYAEFINIVCCIFNVCRLYM